MQGDPASDQADQAGAPREVVDLVDLEDLADLEALWGGTRAVEDPREAVHSRATAAAAAREEAAAAARGLPSHALARQMPGEAQGVAVAGCCPCPWQQGLSCARRGQSFSSFLSDFWSAAFFLRERAPQLLKPQAPGSGL